MARDESTVFTRPLQPSCPSVSTMVLRGHTHTHTHTTHQQQTDASGGESPLYVSLFGASFWVPLSLTKPRRQVGRQNTADTYNLSILFIQSRITTQEMDKNDPFSQTPLGGGRLVIARGISCKATLLSNGSDEKEGKKNSDEQSSQRDDDDDDDDMVQGDNTILVCVCCVCV